MKKPIIPKRCNLIGLVVNALSFDKYIANDKPYSIYTWQEIPYKNDSQLLDTILQTTGKIALTTIFYTDLNALTIRLSNFNNWIHVLQFHLQDCYLTIDDVNKMTDIYLSKSTKTDREFLVKFNKYIERGYYVSAISRMYKYMALVQNTYELLSPKSNHLIDFYINTLNEITKQIDEPLSIQHKYSVIDNSDYYIQQIISKYICDDNNCTIEYNNLQPGKMYLPVITLKTKPYDKVNDLYKKAITPLIIFLECVFDKNDIEKTLENLENIISATALLAKDNYELAMLETWYAILKIAYEKQKHNPEIVIVQPYLPYMHAMFDTANDLDNEFQLIKGDFPLVYAYYLLPITLIVQLINHFANSSNVGHDLEQFFDLFRQVRYIMKFDTMYPLVFSAYYSDLLSYMFNKIQDNEKLNDYSSFIFEQILRLLISFPTIFVSSLHKHLSKTMSVDNYLTFYVEDETLLNRISSRITENHIILSPVTSIHLTAELQKIVYKLVQKINDYKVQIAHKIVYLNKNNFTIQYTLEERFDEHIASIYTSTIPKSLLSFKTVFAICNVS